MNDGEYCFPKEHIKEWMIDNDIQETLIIEATMEIGGGHFYCREFGEVGVTGEGCGKICKAYKPRNGKSGRCCHSANCYVETDKKRILKIKP